MKTVSCKNIIRILSVAIAASASLSAQVSVVTNRNDNARTGQYINETVLTPANVNAARFGKLHGLAHDIGIAGMKAAGDVDRSGELDHGGVMAHFPGAKTFAEIAIEIDSRHVCPLA